MIDETDEINWFQRQDDT